MPKSVLEILASNLRAAREYSAVSQSALAQSASIAPRTVEYIEDPASRTPTNKGESSPKLATVAVLAEKLGLEPWQLLVESFDAEAPPKLADPRGERFTDELLAKLHALDERALRKVENGLRHDFDMDLLPPLVEPGPGEGAKKATSSHSRSPRRVA